MNIKQKLIDWGMLEETEVYTEITEDEKQFFLKAKQRYCEICDIFMKDLRSIKGHMRLKHGGGMKPKNA